MPKATENLISFPQESSGSVLDEILRDGAREMLGKAIEDEVSAYLGARDHLVDESGRQFVVIGTGAGPDAALVAFAPRD